MATSEALPHDDKIARGVMLVRLAAYDDGERAGFLGARGDMRHIPKHFRSDWERGYADGSRHMQEIQHGEERSSAQEQRGLREGLACGASEARVRRRIA